MKLVGAIVLCLNLGLSLAVGLRLLRLPDGGGERVERALAIYFLVGLFVGGITVTAAYAGWSDPTLGMPAPWIPRLHAIGQLCVSLGTTAIFWFTWRTFRPDRRWAAALTALGTLGLVVGLAGRCVHEGFAISVSPGPFHWELYAVRLSALVWVASESMLYYTQMRRRLRLGLVDPLVADRFLLWGVWSGATLLTALSEVIARIVYHFMAGEAAAAEATIHGLAAPIIVLSLTITSVAGLVSASALFLTFFPTAAYRAWVARRAAALAGRA